MRLEEHPLFAGADPDALAPRLRELRVAKYRRGEVLAGPSSREPSVYLVLEGMLRGYNLVPEGGRVLFDVIATGGLDGLLGCFGLLPHFTEAASSATVAVVRRRQLESLMVADTAVTRNLFNILVKRVARRELQLEAIALKRPRQSIARQLLTLAEVFGGGHSGKVRLSVTHQEIADMLGIRRETATIHLQPLSRAGGVRREGRDLVVDLEILRSIVSDDSLREPPVDRAATAAS